MAQKNREKGGFTPHLYLPVPPLSSCIDGPYVTRSCSKIRDLKIPRRDELGRLPEVNLLNRTHFTSLAVVSKT